MSDPVVAGDSGQRSSGNPAAIIAVILGTLATVPMVALDGYILANPDLRSAFMWSVLVFPWPLLVVPALLGAGLAIAGLRHSSLTGDGRRVARWGVALAITAFLALGIAVWMTLTSCGDC